MEEINKESTIITRSDLQQELIGPYISVTIEGDNFNLHIPKTQLICDDSAKLDIAKKRSECKHNACEKTIESQERYILVRHRRSNSRYHIGCALLELEELKKKINNEYFLDVQLEIIAELKSIEKILKQINVTTSESAGSEPIESCGGEIIV